MNDFTLAVEGSTVLLEFSHGDRLHLIAEAVTFAEASERSRDWTCHWAVVGEASILVIYTGHGSVCANSFQGPGPWLDWAPQDIP